VSTGSGDAAAQPLQGEKEIQKLKIEIRTMHLDGGNL
jgi:hypothetical protein